MRKIRFRGKRLSNGKWLKGYYFYVPEDNSHRILSIDDNCVYLDVDPNTLAQFSGLYDQNKTEIYEGDLVCECDQYKGLSEPMEVRFYNGCYDLVRGSEWIGLLWHQAQNLVVVGNIHKND